MPAGPRTFRVRHSRPLETYPLPTPPFPRSDHYDGVRFFNPGTDTDRSLADILRWRRTSTPTPWPAQRANRPYPPPPDRVADGTCAVTFIGHATFLLTTATATILTDPFFSDRASPFASMGPRRVRAPGVALDDLPPIDLILLSHNHYDHMDLASLRRLRGRGTPPVPILTGLGNDTHLARRGIPGASALDWWGAATLRPGLRVTFVPAQHWSSRTLIDRRRTLWGGFVVETDGLRLYFAGDSGYCPWFETIRARCGAPDVALLPIGAYEPRWFMQSQHMNPEDAVRAHRDLGATRSIGMHFGTVQLTDEGIDAPLEALAVARRAAGIADEAFIALDVGETRVFAPGLP